MTAMGTDRDPVRPSDEAKRARAEAEQAVVQADGNKERALEGLAEAAAIVSRLAGQRRANDFVSMFRRAFERQ
jgi:regulator of protease activity HflC (stomatin/prohibitin superfamily)